MDAMEEMRGSFATLTRLLPALLITGLSTCASKGNSGYNLNYSHLYNPRYNYSNIKHRETPFPVLLHLCLAGYWLPSNPDTTSILGRVILFGGGEDALVRCRIFSSISGL